MAVVDEKERLWVVEPGHPMARVREYFEIQGRDV